MAEQSSCVANLLAEAADLPGDEARREAEILLCNALNKPRSYLFAWPEAQVDAAVAERYRQGLAARREGRPLAYLLGRREFWSLDLWVSEATLIPRSDTELLVERALALELPPCADHDSTDTDTFDDGAMASLLAPNRGLPPPRDEAAADRARVLDLGTGSGAIALALARERPGWRVTGVDVSLDALKIACANSLRLDLPLTWRQGSWFEAVAGESFELVVSNPPYVAPDDPHLTQGDLRFEPRAALVAGDAGFAAFDAIIAAAPDHLVSGGWLVLEHGSTQGPRVRERLGTAGFESIASHCDLAGHERVTLGRLPVA